jgi:glutamate-ammonia-ligase adenylyltransferase
VYRRYLDYTALDGLREMKAMIDAEVQRRELADDLKLGPAASARSSSWRRPCS